MENEIEYSIQKFNNALQRLEEALQDRSELAVDGTIQRFEFCFELTWKTLKRVLEYEGEICKTPREVFKSAFRLGLIADERTWLSMLQDRNKMSHVYSEHEAEKVYERIPNYTAVLEKLKASLLKKYPKSD